MIRHALRLACCLLPLLGWGCADEAPDPRKATLCEKLQARNRKCVSALVPELQRRMGAKVPADVKKQLAKPLAAEITKRDFVNLCREQTRGKEARAKAEREALKKCHAATDCAAYARCLLDNLHQFRPKLE